MNHQRTLYAGRAIPTGVLRSLVVPLLAIAGCGPRLSSDELGAVVHGIPQVPGSEKPYAMPQLDEEDKEQADEAEQTDSAAADPGESPKPEDSKSAPAVETAE